MFAVWFSTPGSREIIAGFSTNQREAHKMAKDLYAIKSNIERINDITTGVYFMEEGNIYTSSKPKRAQVMPFLTSMI